MRAGDPAGPYATLAAAKEAGAVTLGVGVFANNVISFLVVAFAVFLLIKAMNTLQREQEEAPAAPTTKECGFCCSKIALKATRCPHCAAELA